MGLRRTLYSNRKELFVVSVIVCVFMFDLSKEVVETYDEEDGNLPRSRGIQIPGEGEADEQYQDIENVGNITTKILDKARLIVYNRVPKCGSQTMSMLINHCSRKNGFKSKQIFENGEVPQRSDREQKAFIKELEEDLKELPNDKPMRK